MSERKHTAGDFVVTAYIPGQTTAGNADSWPILKANEKIRVTGVSWTPAAAVAGDNANNFALAVQNKGAAGGGMTAVTATKTYATGTNGVAHDAEELTLSGTEANLDVAPGEVLSLVRTVTGTGLAMPDGLVEVRFQFRGV